MPITSRVISRHSGEDVEMSVVGYVEGLEPLVEVIFDPKEFNCPAARVMDVFRAIQSGTLAVLCWDDSTNPILPLEGYGVTDLHKFSGLTNPRREGWTGKIVLYVYPPKEGVGHFAISLELAKQRT